MVRVGPSGGDKDAGVAMCRPNIQFPTLFPSNKQQKNSPPKYGAGGRKFY